MCSWPGDICQIAFGIEPILCGFRTIKLTPTTPTVTDVAPIHRRFRNSRRGPSAAPCGFIQATRHNAPSLPPFEGCGREGAHTDRRLYARIPPLSGGPLLPGEDSTSARVSRHPNVNGRCHALSKYWRRSDCCEPLWPNLESAPG